MSLFSRACMTAIALAVTVPLVAALPAAARDRHDGGGHRGFSSGEISGGNISRNSFWKRNHQARNGDNRHRRNRDRNAFGRDIVGGNISRDNRHWKRDWRARNGWGFGRDWQYARPGWVGQPDLWRDRARPYYARPYRPYYAGPYRPYYAGQYDEPERFNNNFYGGSISAYDDPGNGMYFYMDGYGDGMGDGGGYPLSVRPANNAKVITVSPETETASCTYEAGVCVIRP